MIAIPLARVRADFIRGKFPHHVAEGNEVKASGGGCFRDPGVFEFERGKGVLPGGQPGVEPGGAPRVNPVDEAQADEVRLRATADLIRSDLTKVGAIATLRDQVNFSVSSEGLRIDLMDRAQSSFFDSGSAVLRGEAEQILALIAYELGALSNDVVVEGHTDSRHTDEHNLDLSARRARSVVRWLVDHGIEASRLP